MSINFDRFSLQELLDLADYIQESAFNLILTEKIKEGKMVFCEVENGLMN